MPASSAPPPPPASNAKYIVVALLLLVAMGGLVFWKFRPQPPPPGPAPGTVTTIVQGGPMPHRDDDLPPPPDPISSTSASAAKPTSTGGGGGSAAVANGCTPACRGSASSELQGALALRGRQARKCYERELANDPKLQVHMTIAVSVGLNGSTCSATVASSDNPGVASCVANFYRNGGFPPAKGGCATVNVPLNFVPGR
ncbi:MAG: AgmX/PglI C-terminal domain-containing protein [Polyangiaceae bacterium]